VGGGGPGKERRKIWVTHDVVIFAFASEKKGALPLKNGSPLRMKGVFLYDSPT